jgi:CubicO group peptidase (beta-lactamase class C family)
MLHLVALAVLALQDPFPPSTALAESVSPDALARLDALVQGFVDDEEIVGGELLVVVNGRAILRTAYGHRDVASPEPLEVGGVYCVRSMTKPVVGTAALMLIDEGRLELRDRVAEHLPEYDVEGLRDLTVEHLLTHTGGLAMSHIMAADLRAIDEMGGVRAVAALGAEHPLDFPAGSAFQYSDQGADALTAVIEAVTGAPAEDFVRARVLDPLGMEESACVVTADHPLRARVLPAHAGSRGAWTRYVGPDDPPPFPFFLGSQGMYATTTDYARFLELWLDRGRLGKERLVGMRLARKALEPGPHAMEGPTGFPGLHMEYGYMLQLWCDGEGEPVVLGHTGSDGTHAWAFPGQDAMVLYFTQSRGTTTGLRVEEVLGELFLGAPFDPNQAAPPFEDYLGYYWEGEGDLYRAIVRDGDDLALEIVGKAVVPLVYAGDDRWKASLDPSKVLAFDRSEDGAVVGYHIGDHQELRFEPSAGLPDAGELAARVAAAHRLDLIEELGPIRSTAALANAKLDIVGEMQAVLAWPDRYRSDTTARGESESFAVDGDAVRQVTSQKPAVETFEGERAALLRADSPFTRFGDWRGRSPAYRVIQRLGGEDEEVLLVRAGDTSAPAATLYVDARTGRVVRVDSLTHVDMLGRIGQKVRFEDFRDVSGMTLPFRTRVELANPMLGEFVVTVADVELGVAVPASAFALAD